MEEFVGRLWAVAEPGLILALSTLIVALVYFGAAWLSARTKAIQNQDRRQALQDLIGLARDALAGAIKETAQTYTEARKAGRADGKLTAEEQAEARQLAMNAFLTRLGEGGQDLARKAIPNLEEWALHELEGLLWDQKVLEAAVTASPKSPSGLPLGPSG